MHTHEPHPSSGHLQGRSSQSHPFEPRSFEVTYPGQEIASSPTNPFPRRLHEVWMGEHSTTPTPATTPTVQVKSELPASDLNWQQFDLYAAEQPPPSPPRWRNPQANVAPAQTNDFNEQATTEVSINRVTERQTPIVQSVSSSINLQRVGWQDLDFIGGTLEALAKWNFSVPLCKDLIHHYCHGNGTEFDLTALGMAQCNALIDFGNDKRSPQFLRFVNQMGAEIARNAGGNPARLQESIESDVSFDMLGLCNTSGTLGDFTIYAFGKLKVWNPNSNGTDADWSFNGRMWWYDRWDFDKRSASGKGEPGRTKKGSWRTDAGNLLVGVPFDIKTESVPVQQARADAKGGNHYAKWQGNPDGAPLPVVAGIL